MTPVSPEYDPLLNAQRVAAALASTPDSVATAAAVATAVALDERFERSNALDVVDQFFNLCSGGLDLTGLSKEELAEAFEMIVRLLEAGVVGYEYREVNGVPHKVFIDVAMGSDLHRAPLWRGDRFDGYL